MIYYDLDLFKELLSHLGNLTDTSVCFYDRSFNSTDAHTQNVPTFCSGIKQKLQSHCVQTDTTTLKRAEICAENSFYYTCHFGLTEIAQKLLINNQIFGYIIIGPFRMAGNGERDEETVKKFCSQYGTNYESMMNNYRKIPIFSEEKYHSVIAITSALFEYAKNKNIVTMKSDLFNNEIEPYISDNLEKEITIESLCGKFFLTPKQLYNVFIKATLLPPKKYVTVKRITKAKNLIITTDKPMPVIADEVGIPDYNYFIKVFKLIDKHTPSFYRK